MPFQFLAILTLFLSVPIALSRANWITCWIALEINIIAFVPMMLFRDSKLSSSEATLKYFIAQAIGSALFLYGALTQLHTLTYLGLITKAGVPPFHLWFPQAITGLAWNQCLILSSWQKVIPLSFLLLSSSYIAPLVAILRAFFGAFGTLKARNLRQLLAFRSITHMSWILAGPCHLSFVYLALYIFSILPAIILINPNIGQISSKTQARILIRIFSIRGLPPFLGFISKIFLIRAISWGLATALIIGSALTIYVYLSLAFFLTESMSRQISPHPSTLGTLLGGPLLIAPLALLSNAPGP